MKHLVIFLICICSGLYGATYVVTSNADAGANTLRDAITQANTNPGADIINFNFGVPTTITLVSCLPAITQTVTINGYSEPSSSSATGTPTITINLNGTCINGLELNGAASNGCTITGIVLYGSNRGLYLINSGTHTIQGNFIGTNSTGTAIAPSVIAWNGIELDNSPSNTIGGNTLAQRNIISGANEMGIRIQGASNGNTIRGNSIGTDVSGTADIGNNLHGIFVLSGNTGLTIEINLISGNNQSGIFLENGPANIIRNNLIGTNVNGTASIPNSQQGIMLLAASINNTIQSNFVSGNGQQGIMCDNAAGTIIIANQIGTNFIGSGALGNGQSGIFLINATNVNVQGNLISGNNQQGMFVLNTTTTVPISSNYFGTNVAGTAAIPNGQNGIVLENSPNITLQNNVFSGNGQRGLFAMTSTGLIIQNNFFGTTNTGNAALGNTTRGMELVNNCHNAQILNNVISSNTETGLAMNGCLRPIIKGNMVGLGLNGTAVLGNTQHGMEIINCLRPTVGGAAAGEPNYISNNGNFGIQFVLCDSIRLKGNFIGLDVTGTVDRGNNQVGVNISDGRNPTIGGALAGERNYICGNTSHGLAINGATSDRAIVKGNVIGLGTDLSTAIGNGGAGMEILDCENSQIGGTTAAERNYVSMNVNGIVLVRGDNSVIEGNYLGVDGTGLLARGNNPGSGLRVEICDNVTVGGTSIASRNIASANTDNGIVLVHTTNSRVKANFAGLGVDGSTSLGNGFTGILLSGTTTNVTVGGSTFAERNVSSANGYLNSTGDGIRLEGPDGNFILGNYCGTDSTGTLARPNYWGGISMNESDNNIIGGTGAFEGNVCSANLNEGLYLRNANNNIIIGNYVGTDKSGTLQLGNEDWGINISPAGLGSLNNRVGGSLAERNIIAFNKNVPGFADGGPGVYVNNHSHRNTITFNAIYCNEQRGIERNGAGNENIAAPVTLLSDVNAINGTADAGNTIHIYRNTNASIAGWCDCEGEIYVGTTVVDGSGNWSYTHNLGLTVGQTATISATQTNSTGSTSQFSLCVSPLPVELVNFTATRLDAFSARLNWSTASEMNNDYFIVLRSIDGINFSEIGTVDGRGNTLEMTDYSFIDNEVPEATVVYYRLRQIDIDGKSTFSVIRSITGAGSDFTATLSDGVLHIGLLMHSNSAIIRVFASTGQLVYEGTVSGENWVQHDIMLGAISRGAYVVQMQQATSSASVKVVN